MAEPEPESFGAPTDTDDGDPTDAESSELETLERDFSWIEQTLKALDEDRLDDAESLVSNLANAREHHQK